MPIVKIDLRKGKSLGFLKTLMDSIHESMVEILKIPIDDRNQRLTEYDTKFFFSKPPYEYFIEIIMFAGRTKATKKKLYQSIVDRLYNNLKIDKNKVFIILNEQPLENWGVRGGIPADEIKLDFDVEI